MKLIGLQESLLLLLESTGKVNIFNYIQPIPYARVVSPQIKYLEPPIQEVWKHEKGALVSN